MGEYPALQELDEFTVRLRQHAEQKAVMYDGTNRDHTLDRALRFAIEELGEVASAITRERYALAREECLDVAHCAYLLYIALG